MLFTLLGKEFSPIMIAKLFLFALCGVALAQGSEYESFSELDNLKNLMEEGSKRVLEVTSNVEKAPLELKEATEDRLGCLLWEHKLHKTATNKTVSEAVFKGMLKNRWFNNYQCVVQQTQETFQKLDAIESKIPADSKTITEKGVTGIGPYASLMPGFYNYVQDFHKIKRDDLNKAKNEEEKKKVLKEAEDKIKYLKTILQKVDDTVKQIKFKALEEHINFAYQTENNMKKVQKEGAQKIIKCVA